MPFAYTYPTAGGFLEWTSSGLRAQMTLKASANLGIGNVQGNTLSLASLVPSNATLYAGIGNLGAEATAATKISQALGNFEEQLRPFAIASGNQLLQSSVAAPSRTGGTGRFRGRHTSARRGAVPGGPGCFCGTGPSAAVCQLPPINPAAHDGFWHKCDRNLLRLRGHGALSASAASRSCSSCTGSNNSPALVGVAAQINGALVIGSSGNVVADIIATAKGGKSLAEESDFRQLTGNAPVWCGDQPLCQFRAPQASLGNLGQDGTVGQLLAHTTAMLMTGVVNDQESQNTIDLKVNL